MKCFLCYTKNKVCFLAKKKKKDILKKKETFLCLLKFDLWSLKCFFCFFLDMTNGRELFDYCHFIPAPFSGGVWIPLGSLISADIW